jgi:small subunit ribosomal protein S8
MDPIADMLTRIRNGIGAQHTKVDMPHSKVKGEIARILKEEGFISNFNVKTDEVSGHKTLRVVLRFGANGESAITHISRVSLPSRRVYSPKKEIPKVLGGLGINILSTSQGLMTGKAARRANVGGEVMCNVY